MEIVCVLCVLALLAGGCAKNVSLRVMTFNIRTATDADGPNRWEHRRDAMAAMLTDRRPDVIGLQEARPGQIEDLMARVDGYAWVGDGRDGGGRGEFCPIFFDRRRFDVREHGTFWLSEQPDTPASKGWDAAFPRIATWVKLRDKRTGREFAMFNTHLDHRGEQARVEGARLIVARLNQLADGLPIIVTGDLNRRPDSDVYRIMTDTLRDATRARGAGHTGPAETYTGWLDRPRSTTQPSATVDYILLSPSIGVRWTQTLPSDWGGRQLSDHRAVLADIDL
jgi:endonuclease/exonuclease/phosphatase family metal-dependent hydrolase